MFKNYFKTSWRNIIKEKGYSGFNILGLAVGMAVALMIGLWVRYQFSYDRFLPDYGQACRIMVRSSPNGVAEAGGWATCLPLADAIRRDVPEVKYVAQADFGGLHSLMSGDKKLYSNGLFAGEDFLKIFRFQLLEGSAEEVLKEPASIVLTRSAAIALFGHADPINKTLRLDNLHEVKVTGVLADLPANSSLSFDYIIPFTFYVQTQDWIRQNLGNWNMDPIQTFVALQPNVPEEQAGAALRPIYKKYDQDGYKAEKLEAFIYPLKDWHLYSNFKNGVVSGGFIDYVRMFSIIGLLVLVIACINFTNLSIARSERRAREVGVRKAIGSLRKHIIFQFLMESVLITLIAFVVALMLVSISLPAFNSLTSTTIDVPWSSAPFWGVMLSYVLLTGLLAGSRPAFYLSSFRPVTVLKGALVSGRAATLPRKILVVLQFTCSVALIISTVIVYQQIQYARNRPTGFLADRLIMTNASSDLDHNYAALKNDLMHTGLVASVTKATTPATDLYSAAGVDDWQGKYAGESLGVANVGITDDYFKTLGMQLIKGRNFDRGMAEDTSDVILNEAAVRRMRFKDPINQVIFWNGHRKIRVIGVVKDALMVSPFTAAQPSFFFYNPSWSSSIMYRLAPGADAGAAIAAFAPIFSKYNPAYPYSYRFADESYAAKFSQEVLIGKLSGIFAVLATFVSCLGLLGLAAYVAQQRTKEIGIRKVLGASVAQLWVLLSREFVVLVVLSCLIAAPIAFYFMHGWLQTYDYRIGIGPGVFIASGAAAIVVTVLTMSLQAIKAALMNPVKSLRATL
ncbi:MAG TPA: ABC transporter permease [Puia sp.]|nr:ABC transporter permease [Puia sp.]